MDAGKGGKVNKTVLVLAVILFTLCALTSLVMLSGLRVSSYDKVEATLFETKTSEVPTTVPTPNLPVYEPITNDVQNTLAVQAASIALTRQYYNQLYATTTLQTLTPVPTITPFP